MKKGVVVDEYDGVGRLMKLINIIRFVIINVITYILSYFYY